MVFYVNSRCNKHILSLYVSGVLVYDCSATREGELMPRAASGRLLDSREEEIVNSEPRVMAKLVCLNAER
jgi:hypothetical protein